MGRMITGSLELLGYKMRDGEHCWRSPVPPEPLEEGGVCIKCGAYANAEGETPCPGSEPLRRR